MNKPIVEIDVEDRFSHCNRSLHHRCAVKSRYKGNILSVMVRVVRGVECANVCELPTSNPPSITDPC